MNLTTHRHVEAEADHAGHRTAWWTAGTTPRLPTLRGPAPAGATRRRRSGSSAPHIGVARVNGVHEIELLESLRADSPQPHRPATHGRAPSPSKWSSNNWPDGHVEHRRAVNNPEDPGAGEPRGACSQGRLWIERDDFMLDPPRKFYRLAPGREVRLRAGYFLQCNDVETDSDGDRGAAALHLRPRDPAAVRPPTGARCGPPSTGCRPTMRWTPPWRSTTGSSTTRFPAPTVADPLESYNPASRELIAGAKLEPELKKTAPGEVVQFERLGYFAHDPDTPLLYPPHRRPTRRVGQHPETPPTRIPVARILRSAECRSMKLWTPRRR